MEVKRYKVSPDVTSRYKNSDRILYDTDEEIIETPDRIEFKYSNEDKFFVVTTEFENRLDLVSFKFYKSALYWWAIASASLIDDPFNVPVGTTLRIPPLGSVMGR